MLRLFLSVAAAGLLISSPASAATEIAFPPADALSDFEEFDVDPGSWIPIGDSYQLGDFKLEAVRFNLPCGGRDCLNVAAAEFSGVDSPHGNFLFAKAGWDLRISDVTGTNVVIHSGEAAALFAAPIQGVAITDPNNNSLLESLTPEDGPFARFTTFGFGPLGQNAFWTLNFSSGPGSSHLQVALDNIRVSRNVPEPSSWALMIAGLGLAGAALRRRAQRT